MRKILLTSVFAIAVALPSFADIAKDAESATCDNNTIGTTTGHANLQAQWTPNTINLKWYDGTEEIEIANNAAQKTCTYDGAITLPEIEPTRVGYAFGGWQVVFDLRTLSEYLDIEPTDWGFSRLDGTAGGAEAKYGLTLGEWVDEFSYGTLKGIARCSIVGARLSKGNTGNPTNDTGKDGARYCWCKATGFDQDKSGVYSPVASSHWVFLFERTANMDSCEHACALDCPYHTRYDRNVRRAIYGITQ